MKKRLNVDLIQNELRGGSAFFPGYKGNQSPTSPDDQQKLRDATKSVHKPKPTTEEPFAPTPKIPEKPAVKTPIAEGVPPLVPKPHIPERANAPTPERSNKKRIITRNSFEIYEDQMDSLRRLSFQEKMDGKLGSMSGMVREAIDNYLLKRTTGK